MWEDKIKFNRDEKYDIQLAAALVAERRLAEIFATAKIERFEFFELKSEKWQWRRTGNVAIEYRRAGHLSGISVTQADFWVHELCNDEGTATLGYLMWPVPRLKELCRAAIKAGHNRKGVGDDSLSDVALLKVIDLLGLLLNGSGKAR
jgi:hypothetical protein